MHLGNKPNIAHREKIRISLLDPAGTQDSFDKTSLQRSRDRDMTMFNKLRSHYVNGDKIIFYAGQAHTQGRSEDINLRIKVIIITTPALVI